LRQCTTVSLSAVGGGFFQNLPDRCVREAVNKAEFDGFVSQQAQAPTGMSSRRIRASQGGDLGTLSAVDGRRFARARFIEKRCFKTFIKVAPLDVENRGATDLERLGDAIWMLAAMQEIKNAGTGLRANWHRATPQ